MVYYNIYDYSSDEFIIQFKTEKECIDYIRENDLSDLVYYRPEFIDKYEIVD